MTHWRDKKGDSPPFHVQVNVSPLPLDVEHLTAILQNHDRRRRSKHVRTVSRSSRPSADEPRRDLLLREPVPVLAVKVDLVRELVRLLPCIATLVEARVVYDERERRVGAVGSEDVALPTAIPASARDEKHLFGGCQLRNFRLTAEKRRLGRSWQAGRRVGCRRGHRVGLKPVERDQLLVSGDESDVDRLVLQDELVSDMFVVRSEREGAPPAARQTSRAGIPSTP